MPIFSLLFYYQNFYYNLIGLYSFESQVDHIHTISIALIQRLRSGIRKARNDGQHLSYHGIMLGENQPK